MRVNLRLLFEWVRLTWHGFFYWFLDIEDNKEMVGKLGDVKFSSIE